MGWKTHTIFISIDEKPFVFHRCWWAFGASTAFRTHAITRCRRCCCRVVEASIAAPLSASYLQATLRPFAMGNEHRWRVSHLLLRFSRKLRSRMALREISLPDGGETGKGTRWLGIGKPGHYHYHYELQIYEVRTGSTKHDITLD